MISRIYVSNSIVKGMFIKEEDYLKVVEEKENVEKYYEKEKELRKNIEDNLHRVQNHLQCKVNECNERDEVINKLVVKKEHYKDYIKCLEKEKREKDGEIERLKEANKYCADCSGSRVHINKLEKELKEMTKHKDKTFLRVLELEKQNEYYAKEYERLKNLYEPEIQYEEWCWLYYEFKLTNGNVKPVKQEMLVEDAHELIGMDSDNWRFYSIQKFKKGVK